MNFAVRLRSYTPVGYYSGSFCLGPQGHCDVFDLRKEAKSTPSAFVIKHEVTGDTLLFQRAKKFHQFDANKDGKLDLQEQEAERQSRAAQLTQRPAPSPATPGNPAMEARRKEHMRKCFTEQIVRGRTNQSAPAARQITPQEQQRVETILKQMENRDRTRRAEYEAVHANQTKGSPGR